MHLLPKLAVAHSSPGHRAPRTPSCVICHPAVTSHLCTLCTKIHGNLHKISLQRGCTSRGPQPTPSAWLHLCGRAEAVLAHIHLDLWAAPKKSCPHALEPHPSGPSPPTGGCRGGAQIRGPRLQTVASSCPAPPPPHTSTVHKGSPPGWADAMMDILGFFRVSSWKNKGQGLDDVGMCNLRQEAPKWDRRAGVSPADHCQAACGVRGHLWLKKPGWEGGQGLKSRLVGGRVGGSSWTPSQSTTCHSLAIRTHTQR